MKASLHNLGCKVNAYETESMQQLLEKAGYEIVPFGEYADLYIINTCSVTNIADRKSRQMIHKARKLNPDAILVAAGCYAQMFTKDIEDEGTVDIVLGNNHKKDLLEIVERFKKNRDEKIFAVEDLSKTSDYEVLRTEDTAEHTRAFIKIQDGCNQFCTYCIIPYARGRIRSRDKESIIDEVSTLAAKGYREVVLTGIHLSSYGHGSDYKLIDVIEDVARVEGIDRIRLGSLEPGIINREFLDRLIKVDKICPHFHLSLQSGCDSVLKRMNRRYTTKEYLDRCKLIREYYKHPAITTDIIVGFPGETEEEFNTTLGFARECDIYEIHIFKYSRRKGTKADTMPGQLTEKEKSARSNRLSEVAEDNTKRFLSYYLEEEVAVLFEECVNLGGIEYYTGYTKEYVKVAIKLSDTGENLSNTISYVRIEGFLEDNYILYGQLA